MLPPPVEDFQDSSSRGLASRVAPPKRYNGDAEFMAPVATMKPARAQCDELIPIFPRFP